MGSLQDELRKLHARTSAKWSTYPDHILPLFVAEMDFPIAEPVAEALIEAIRRSDTGYAGPDKALPEAFAGFAAERWGWRVEPARVSSTTDVSVVIVESLRASIEPGDGVVITSPVYPPFFELVTEAGGRVVDVPLIGDEPRLDLDGLEEAFAAGARAFLLCNPHNPLGLLHTADELAAVAELADRYGVTVVSDEIHAPLAYDPGAFTPYLSVSETAAEHGICASSASKGWNLAGLKCAVFVTAGERMTRRIAGLPGEVHFRTSLFGRIGNTAAFARGSAWLDDTLRRLDENRRLLGELLAERMPRVGYRIPAASYLAWLDFRALGWGEDPAARARKAGVALSPGPAFGPAGRGFARLNFGCSPELLTEAIDRLAAQSR